MEEQMQVVKNRSVFAQMELESVAVSDVLELTAVLDAGVFTSLLTVSVQHRRKGSTSIFVFQCDDIKVSTRTHTHTQLL